MGKIIHKLVNQFHRLKLEAMYSRSMIKGDMSISPDFQWEPKIHGKAEAFWVIVIDYDSETILHCEQFILKDKYHNEQRTVKFYVQIYEPQPQYFIKVISDRWLQCK